LILESNKRVCLLNLSTSHPEAAALRVQVEKLMDEAKKVEAASTRTRTLAAVEKYREAASVAVVIGGAAVAFDLATTSYRLTYCFLSLNDMGERRTPLVHAIYIASPGVPPLLVFYPHFLALYPCKSSAAAAARMACSALREASASGSRSKLVEALLACGAVALKAPDEMAKAESESRTQGARYHGGLDLAQEARVSLAIETGLLRFAYNTIAVNVCDTALDAAGGRDSPAAANDWRVPSLRLEAQARGSLGVVLRAVGEEQQKQWGVGLQRQAVALLRRLVDEEKLDGTALSDARRTLAIQLCNLGGSLNGAGMWGAQDGPGSGGMAHVEACLREALELCGGIDVGLEQAVLQNLVNMAGHPEQRVGPTESEAFRAQLDQCLRQQGRLPETSCTICLEPLAPSADGAEDAARDGGRGDGYTLSSVHVLDCMHQFHRCCLLNWMRVKSSRDTLCPLCKT